MNPGGALSALEQLLQISSSALISTPVPDAIPLVAPFGALGTELHALLARRNGFYAFESALHVFPYGSAVGVLDLASWNAQETWRREYGDLASDCLFFAEDAFGFQFCLRQGQVCTFDAETAGVTPVARSLEEWGAALLLDFRVLLGHPVVREWQVANGALAPGCRLAPRTPFVLGGAFEVAHLYAADQVELMRFRGQLAARVHNLPDGARVKMKITP